jgi:outer membrane protein
MKSESLKVLKLSPRQFVSMILAITCALMVSSTTMAQTPAPQQSAQQSTTRPEPTSPPIPERSIGLDPGKVLQWSMRDAILAALENNVDIEMEKTNVRSAQWNVLASQGVYDPITRSGISYDTSTRPNINQFSGAQGGSLSNNTYSYSLGFQQNVQKTGGLLQIDFLNNRASNNFDQLAVNYQPSLSFQFTQPLFRNFKIDSNRNQIRLQKKQLDMSDAQFRQRVIEIITSVMTAYWNLYVAYENERIGRASLALAEKSLTDNKRQVEVGTLAPISITQAATVVESRRAQVYQSMNQVAVAENALKRLVVDGPNSDLWKTKIETTQKFEVQSVALPLDDALRLAEDNRYELKRFNLQKEFNQYNIDFWRNQAKPQVNFVANYGLSGVGGTARTATTGNCQNPVNVNGQPTCLNLTINQNPDGTFAPGVSQTPFQQNASISPTYLGGYGTSLRNLFSNDFRAWSVGFQFQLPLRNRFAKANLALAREADKSNELAIRNQLQIIEEEVRNAVQAVDTARQRIDSTRKAREYADEQLEGEQKRLTAGLGTVFEVLTRQNELVNAQVAENQAKSDYAIAVANLQRVLSTTFSENNIQIPEAKVPMK